MHHKRARPKHQRMGCHCKYWKDERGKNSPDKRCASDRRRLQEDFKETADNHYTLSWELCECANCMDTYDYLTESF